MLAGLNVIDGPLSVEGRLIERAPEAADQIRAEVFRALELLDESQLGRSATRSDGRNARRWPVETLVIFDRARGDVLEVLCVHDARRAPIERE